MPDGVGVSSVLNDQKLTLSFNAALSFDLADAKVAAPPNIASIKQKIEGDSSAVEVGLIGEVDVHSFREEKNYIVDVAFQQPEKPSALTSPASDASHGPAPAAPASPAASANPPATLETPAHESAPSQPSAEIAPLTSETFAQQARIEIRPEGPPKTSPAPETPKPEPAAKQMPAPAAEAPPKMTLAAAEPPAATGPPAIGAGDGAAVVGVKRNSDGLNL